VNGVYHGLLNSRGFNTSGVRFSNSLVNDRIEYNACKNLRIATTYLCYSRIASHSNRNWLRMRNLSLMAKYGNDAKYPVLLT
jgi:hypothetical protein